MRKLKRGIALGLSVCMLFSVCACGSKSTAESESTSGKTAADSGNENDERTSQQGSEYSLSEYLSKGETIWYQVDGTGKDSRVMGIYLIEADGTLTFTKAYDGTLGELEQMEDTDIITLVNGAADERKAGELQEIEDRYGIDGLVDYCKQNYQISDANNALIYAMVLNGYIVDFYGDVLDDYGLDFYSFDDNRVWNFLKGYGEDPMIIEKPEEILTAIKDAYQKNYLGVYETEADKAAKTAISYNLVIKTDQTGNSTSKEMIVFKDNVPTADQSWSYAMQPYVLSLSEIKNDEEIQIYDSYFGGYCDSGEGGIYSYFLTRIDEQCTFRLDEVGTDGISLDNVNDFAEREVLFTFKK